MLSELAKKDVYWRWIAFKICDDKFLADDLVQEMYLRRYENDRGQEWNDYYIVCTIRSIYLNYKKTNKLIPKAKIQGGLTDEIFEPTDYERELLDRVMKLDFKRRELLELNYDYSLRQIQDNFNINYGYIYKLTKQARQFILGKNINQYKNKRLKYKKMAQSRGLGDTIEKIFKIAGIKRIVRMIVPKGCGCDKRREDLNIFWHYKLKPKCLTAEEIKEYGHFILTRKCTLTGNGKAKGRLENRDIDFVCEFYAIVFNNQGENIKNNISSHVWYPECRDCLGTVRTLVGMMYKLDTVYLNNVVPIEEVEEVEEDKVTT